MRRLLSAMLLFLACAAQAQAPAARAAAAATSRNAYEAGGQVRPAGPVAGDLVAVGGRITVDQPVGGDAILAGGAVDVRAPVGDDLRAAGGDLTIESTVGGELLAAGGSVEVRPTAVVSGPARLYGASVTVGGRIDGPLEASGQKVVLAGEIRGDAHVVAEQVELAPGARLAGALRYSAGSELKRADGAMVGGAITREDAGMAPPPGAREAMERRAPSPGAAWAGGVLSFLALLACAAVFLLLLPGLGAEAPERIRAEPWLALAVGFASLVAVPLLAVLLFVTLLGIPLGLALMALYPVLLLAGFIVGVLFLARLLPPALRQPAPAGFGATIGWFAAALALMLVVARVPFAGGVLLALTAFAGIGGFVLELVRRRRGPWTPAPPAVHDEAGTAVARA